MSVYLTTDPTWIKYPLMLAFGLGNLLASLLVIVALVWIAHAIARYFDRKNWL